MSEVKEGPLRIVFARKLGLKFNGAKISSNAGLLLYSELDAALGLTAIVQETLDDLRTGAISLRSITALLRRSVLGRLGGYEDTNDAERLRFDPAMRRVT